MDNEIDEDTKYQLKLMLKYINNAMNDESSLINNECLLFYNGQDIIIRDDTYNDNIKDIMINDKTLRIIKYIFGRYEKNFIYDDSNCITVHKSQGSGYNTVIFILTDPNMQYNMLYTAISRAKDKLIIIIPSNRKNKISNISKYITWKKIIVKKDIKYNCNAVISNKDSNIERIIKIIYSRKLGWFLNYLKALEGWHLVQAEFQHLR